MKVFIGEYKDWIGAFQLADLLQKVGVSEDRCHEIGKWLSRTWVQKVCEWIDSKKKRKVKVKIDSYDTWELYHTLSLIILPCLKQLKEEQHGAAIVDDEDVPEELKSTSAPAVVDEYDTDDNFFKRWDYVLDQMIWSFQEVVDETWEDQFHTGEIDILWEQCPDNPDLFEMKDGPNDTHVFDHEGYMAHQERINNGFRLFGRYFQNLWT